MALSGAAMSAHQPVSLLVSETARPADMPPITASTGAHGEPDKRATN